MTARHQDVEILEGLSTSQKAQGHHRDAMQMVRNLQARIEVKKEVMEEEQREHVRRHAQLQSVVEAQMKEAQELRGRLTGIALAFECAVCFEKLGAGSVSFGCGHTFCHRPTCGSSLVEICPECSRTVTTRVQLFGALSDVGGLLEQVSAVPDVGQVQRLAAENAKASLEEIRKRSEKDKAVWQREKEEMQRQLNRLQEEVLAAANNKAVWPSPTGTADANDYINLTVNSFDGEILHFKMKKKTALLKLMEAYCARTGLQMSQVRFCFDGDRLLEHRTPEELEMQNDDPIHACLSQVGDIGEWAAHPDAVGTRFLKGRVGQNSRT
jgi:small ubiquitin-related modifier